MWRNFILFQSIISLPNYPTFLDHAVKIFIKILIEGTPLFIAEQNVQVCICCGISSRTGIVTGNLNLYYLPDASKMYFRHYSKASFKWSSETTCQVHFECLFYAPWHWQWRKCYGGPSHCNRDAQELSPTVQQWCKNFL